ncbi:hypothetical protein FKM82_022146 [Ascaphus truei]
MPFAWVGCLYVVVGCKHWKRAFHCGVGLLTPSGSFGNGSRRSFGPRICTSWRGRHLLVTSHTSNIFLGDVSMSYCHRKRKRGENGSPSARPLLPALTQFAWV